MDIQSAILKILNKSKSSAEYEQLKLWKEETKANLEIYQEINRIVTEGGSMNDYREFNTQAGYNRLQNKMNKPNPLKSLKLWLALLLIFILGLGVYLSTDPEKVEVPTTYLASKNMETFFLPDGSNIHLNQNSSIERLSSFEKIREVSLKGEAFFNIEEDVERPFRIQLSKGRFIEVLGTSFNVNVSDDSFKVVVESGKVGVHTLDREIILTKGDVLELIDGSYTKYENNDQNILSWKDKILHFDNVPIITVLEDIQKHYDLKFDFSKIVKQSNCKITSEFKTDDLNIILQELSKIVSLEYSINNDNGKYSFTNLNCG